MVSNERKDFMRTLWRTTGIVLIIAAAALAATNPGPDDFHAFAEQQLEEAIVEELGDSELGRALAGAGTELISSYLEDVTVRENYGLVSIYAIHLTDEDDEPAWRFLGIGGQFVLLDEPD